MTRDVVLIHGMWCHAGMWERVRARLDAAGYRCHVPTLPYHDHGGNAERVGDQSLADYRSFLLDFVMALGLPQPPILIGHSMGSLLAQQLAVTVQPPALVLLTSAPPAGVFGLRWSNLVAFLRALSRWGFWRRAHKPSATRASISAFNHIDASRHAQMYAQLVPESGRALAEIAYWFADPQRAAAVESRAIRCPVYVVAADGDCLTPAGVVRRVAALYPQARLREYSARGHWVIDDPQTDQMMDELITWLESQEHATA